MSSRHPSISRLLKKITPNLLPSAIVVLSALLSTQATLAQSYEVALALPPGEIAMPNGSMVQIESIKAVERSPTGAIVGLVLGKYREEWQSIPSRWEIFALRNGSIVRIAPAAGVPADAYLLDMPSGIVHISPDGVSGATALASGPAGWKRVAARISGLNTDAPTFSLLFPINERQSTVTAVSRAGDLFGRSPFLMEGEAATVLTPPFIALAGAPTRIVRTDFFDNDGRELYAEITSAVKRPNGFIETTAWNGRNHSSRITFGPNGRVTSNIVLRQYPESFTTLFPWPRAIALSGNSAIIHMTEDRYDNPGFSTDRVAKVLGQAGELTINDDVTGQAYIPMSGADGYETARQCITMGLDSVGDRSVQFCADGHALDNSGAPYCIAQQAGFHQIGDLAITPLADKVLNLESSGFVGISAALAMSYSGELIGVNATLENPIDGCPGTITILRKVS